jgi:UDP:flavonoid glycosyltransferase YjiC (YdhE family)
VYVTLGTVSYGAVEVLRRAILAVAAHGAEVLVAAGPAGDPALLGDLAANVHTEKFVPQAEVLRHVDLVVHHGGTGTMLGALAEGLPQLILPQGADQPFNGMMIERAGAGRALPNEAQTPAALEEAVGALLAEGPERLTAKRIAEEIAAMPAPSPALLAF